MKDLMYSKNNKIKITITKDKEDRTKAIDMNIYGVHFDGSGISNYKIINDGGSNKLIVEFSSQNIEQEIKKDTSINGKDLVKSIYQATHDT